MGPKERGKEVKSSHSHWEEVNKKIILIKGAITYCQESGKWNSEREQTFPGIHYCFLEENEIM
jgi:hypothetical protein